VPVYCRQLALSTSSAPSQDCRYTGFRRTALLDHLYHDKNHKCKQRRCGEGLKGQFPPEFLTAGKLFLLLEYFYPKVQNLVLKIPHLDRFMDKIIIIILNSNKQQQNKYVKQHDIRGTFTTPAPKFLSIKNVFLWLKYFWPDVQDLAPKFSILGNLRTKLKI